MSRRRRTIEAYRPTLLIDEADTFLRDNDELRGIINSGHRKGGSVLRTVGDDHEVRAFSTYSACAIALIGRLPETLQDRSVIVSLKRRLLSEPIASFRPDRAGQLDELARQAARWAGDNADRISDADPEMPEGIFNREADNWRPLLAIADAAGDDWPERAREVLKAAHTAEVAARNSDRLPSGALVASLVVIEGRPWAEYPPLATAALRRSRNANTLAAGIKLSSLTMSPMEKNARRLVGVLAEFFPAGSDCQDLRLKFEKIANRKHATFYLCLRFAKDNHWIVSDGQTYTLNPDGCWRLPPIGADVERHQFEHVLASRAERIEKLEARNRRLNGSRKAIAAGEAAGPAISALVEIMSDPAVSIPKRIAAAEGLLAYKSPQDVVESAKLFLCSVFSDPEQNIDHRLAATTALRRAEDVRMMPPIERPPVRTDTVDPAEPEETLAEWRRGAEHMGTGCNSRWPRQWSASGPKYLRLRPANATAAARTIGTASSLLHSGKLSGLIAPCLVWRLGSTWEDWS